MLLPDSPMPDITGSDTSMPAKKLKLVSDVKLDPASGMWLSLNVLNVVISFSHIDRKDLCDSDQVLTDNPINFDQNLKKNSIEGLESVLLRTQHTAKISNGIQFGTEVYSLLPMQLPLLLAQTLQLLNLTLRR